MKEFNANKEIESLSKAIIIAAILCIFYTMLGYYFTNKRLNAHKEVIELQQEQINKLILNAKKHERNK